MKSNVNDNSQVKYRRHSVRLFNDDLLKLNKSDDNNETYIEHDSSSASSFSNNNTATTSFTATSSSFNHKSDSNDTIPSTSNNHLTPYNQQQNRNNKASELFRTDFITAMKLGTEHLTEDNCLRIADQWKLEWEKGVQVPNGKFITKPNVCHNRNYTATDDFEDDEDNEDTSYFNQSSNQTSKMPIKYVCPIDDKHFNPNINEPHLIQRITNIQNRKLLSDSLISISKYEYDETDDIWLTKINDQFTKMNLARLNHMKLEKIIENFENQSFEMLKNYLDKLCLYKIEYDPAVVCDVCRSPDSDPSNEIVFCDGCNTCVHQNCYGIEIIPEGNWLCSACEYGGQLFRPDCTLCPNKGGALKPTKDYKQWCHVSCVLWTPEVTFGNPDKYEPVINISKIPNEKWLLKCSLCKYKKGCCVECSVNRCSYAFHITCAFRHNLRTTEQTNEDGQLEFTVFCKKHSKVKRTEAKNDQLELSVLNTTNPEDKADINDISISEERFHLSLQSMNETERKTEIIKRLETLYHKFYNKVSCEKTINDLELHNYSEQINFVFNYWKLKRRFNQTPNKPLISFRSDKPLDINRIDLGSLSLKNSLFLDIRRRLEYLRNLCFVIKKREKKKEKYIELNRKYFTKLAEYLEKYKTPVVTNNSKQKQQSETWSSCRIRDLLQTKNEKSIYDFPEKWQMYDEQIKNTLNTSIPFNTTYETIDSESNQPKMKQQRSRIKSASSDTITNIKDISINVLNNNKNTSNFDTTTPNNSKTNSNKELNLNYLINCENNISEIVNSERRLLRSFSLYPSSEGTRNSLSLENNCLKNNPNLNDQKARLSLPPIKRSISNQSANKSKMKPDVSINELQTALKNQSKLKEETKKVPINNNRKKRPMELQIVSTAKRQRPNEPINEQYQQTITTTPRFNLRTKILIEK